ncbi:sulfurtransferase [Anabaena cylindrica FACHB-243]|uniref:thiosulfate sulfurtransferase n=1 Tax=Anabaena cylindrica (strain ATCC 27899 / PCC 7122) TaxID=272123 RepID=K9ZL11_ANACC|nr:MULTISPECIES: sulfurtransferase [Anabaena]AFZ59025.1 Rhodanese-like protein [Anabaena cylindrica PCC 7122]MBD2420635.1 sulfurtransferase [Anabaena cylindrica FACHB-243]MBY5283831.1 sulfurtransferase [Anabaena sp. CCAP 1446/1C]MBY5309735.1 sulfurtransferase [Anabaena sp. CCAP 1446/1C]MCM2408595.1 sulfurtransferase [Anabaena sp. CCAP 1446/1C]
MDTKTLISPQELFCLLAENSPQIVIIDTRSSEEYAISHLPGAINIREFFTYLLDDSSAAGLKKLQEYFAEIMSEVGVSGTERLIVYEDVLNKGYGQSCRAAFLLNYLGCAAVYILHGGYQGWLAAELPTTNEVAKTESSIFRLHPNTDIMVTKDEMLQAINNPAIIKLDVRDRIEWQGLSSSPYSPDFCPRKGRIPNSIWLEWHLLMNSEAQIPMFHSPAEILKICQSVGITSDSVVYIYCFKGSRAANTLIALQQVGIQAKNYFGSWNEWSREFSLPIDSQILQVQNPTT